MYVSDSSLPLTSPNLIPLDIPAPGRRTKGRSIILRSNNIFFTLDSQFLSSIFCISGLRLITDTGYWAVRRDYTQSSYYSLLKIEVIYIICTNILLFFFHDLEFDLHFLWPWYIRIYLIRANIRCSILFFYRSKECVSGNVFVAFHHLYLLQWRNTERM